MKNRLKPVFTALLYFLFLQASTGQDQSDMTDFLRKKFTDYCKSVPREELYVQTDRDDYISGEEIWFSTFLFDRKENSLSSSNSITYFEILNSENRPVVQKRLRITAGFGSGQALLPDSLRSGVYMIRAYTNYMRNFLPGNCFMKEIKILNALNPPAAVTYNSADQELTVSKDLGGIAEIKQRFDVSGISVTADGKNPDVLEIEISSDDRYRSVNGNNCYLFIQTRGNINRVSRERLSAGNTVISVPKSALLEGINQVTIFDSKGRPAAESYYFTPKKQSSSVKINSEDSFYIRSKISFEIDMNDVVAKVNKASGISVSVAPVINVKSSEGIIDYMVFASEFGIIPSILSAGGKISDLPAETVDNMLTRIRSNWIDWTKIISGGFTGINFRPESNYHYLSGKLISKSSQLPDSGKYVFMSLPGKAAGFQYAKTDRNGNFTFSLINDERVNDLIIQPADAGKSSTVKIESPFSENYLTPGKTTVTVFDEALRSRFSKLSTNYQVNRIYSLTSLGRQMAPVITPVKRTRFYGKPDIGLVMADYIKLPVMQEVFFELLPGTSLKSKRSVYEITVADPLTNRVFDDPPGLLIDGVIINDPALIANIDPEIVERIDVVKEKYYVGDYLFYGLINVVTRAGDFSSFQLPAYAVRVPYRVAEPGWSFTSPDYSTDEKKSSRIPDFRNTLYWNPSVKPEKDGKARVEFWSSDQASDYVINVQGTGADGKPVSVSKIISVKK